MQKLSSFPQTSSSSVSQTPGIILSPDKTRFADGIEWGHDCYFEDVDTLVTADGTPHQGPWTLTDLQSGRIRQAKVRDITSTDIVQFADDLMKNPEFKNITQEEK